LRREQRSAPARDAKTLYQAGRQHMKKMGIAWSDSSTAFADRGMTCSITMVFGQDRTIDRDAKLQHIAVVP